MMALPVRTPRTLPSESTVATDDALLANVNVAAQSEPPLKVAVGVSLIVPPMLIRDTGFLHTGRKDWIYF